MEILARHDTKVPYDKLSKPPYVGLGKLSSYDLGVKLPEEQLPDWLEVGWDLLGIDWTQATRVFNRSFGAPSGHHKSIITINTRYLEMLTNADIPEYRQVTNRRNLICQMFYT